MKEVKFRHETKHLITYGEYLAIQTRLKAVAFPDTHAVSQGSYQIRSLYFDNYRDRVLQEKLDGVNDRDKFRIRCYNMDFSMIHLEKKSKRNGLCQKQSVVITEEETKKLLDGDYEFLRFGQQALQIELYSRMQSELLRPRVLVDYVREPYIYQPGNVRITFDTMLRTSLFGWNFFDQASSKMSAQLEPGILMEVKYDEFLPEVIWLCLQIKERPMQAFSKYAACRRFG